nr:BLUF domain-containing protein [Nocardioides flavescens]
MTYVSTADPSLTSEHLLELLRSWRPVNASHDLTGMLLYSEGNVIQTLEGPEDSVDTMYDTIAADGRHHGVIVLHREEVAERAFPDWSMGFGRYDQAAGIDVDGVNGFLRESTEDPQSGSALRLLEIFRSTMR